MLSVNELEERLIDLAFAEDIGDGDHTTLCCIPEDAMGKSHLLIKDNGILAGVEIAKRYSIGLTLLCQLRFLLMTESRLRLVISQWSLQEKYVRYCRRNVLCLISCSA